MRLEGEKKETSTRLEHGDSKHYCQLTDLIPCTRPPPDDSPPAIDGICALQEVHFLPSEIPHRRPHDAAFENNVAIICPFHILPRGSRQPISGGISGGSRLIHLVIPAVRGRRVHYVKFKKEKQQQPANALVFLPHFPESLQPHWACPPPRH